MYVFFHVEILSKLVVEIGQEGFRVGPLQSLKPSFSFLYAVGLAKKFV